LATCSGVTPSDSSAWVQVDVDFTFGSVNRAAHVFQSSWSLVVSAAATSSYAVPVGQHTLMDQTAFRTGQSATPAALSPRRAAADGCEVSFAVFGGLRPST
jgi:hypothetical protein